MEELLAKIIFFAGFGALGWALMGWFVAFVWVNMKDYKKFTSSRSEQPDQSKVALWTTEAGDDPEEGAAKPELGLPVVGLIKALQECCAFLKLFEGPTRSAWENSREVVRYVESLVGRIEAGKIPTRREIEALVAPGGTLQRVSLSRGWGEDFIGLAAEVDKAIIQVYGERQNFCKRVYGVVLRLSSLKAIRFERWGGSENCHTGGL